MRKPPSKFLTKALVTDLYVTRRLPTRFAAQMAKVSEPTFIRYMKIHGIKSRAYPAPDLVRKQDILELREKKHTFNEIAAIYGLSRQRIHQIVNS